MAHEISEVSSEPAGRARSRVQGLLGAGVPWLFLWIVLLPVATFVRGDTDLWGNVRFGLDILKTHSLPLEDPYSFTQDLPWINHEWLSELMIGAAYQAGGAAGLIALKAVLVMTVLAVVATAFRGVWPPLGCGFVLLVAWGTLPIAHIRPHLWTLLGVSLLCRLLVQPAARWWWMAIIPAMFVVWANLHGGWILGAALLAIWTGGAVVRRDRPLLACGTAAASALATLATPYGWQLWARLATTVGFTRDVEEWQPLFTMPPSYWLPWVIALAAAVAAAWSKPRPRGDHLAMMAVLFYSSARVTRLAPHCLAASAILVSPTVRLWSSRVPRRWRLLLTPAPSAAPIVVGVPLVASALAAWRLVSSGLGCVPVTGAWAADAVAARALRGNRGTMITWFNWGEYAIWHLGPDLRVSMDGRRETVYSERVLAAHGALYTESAEGLQYLARTRPDYVWLPAQLRTVRDWLANNGYRVDVMTARSFVAVRRDRPRLHATDVRPRDLCFPGP